MRKGVKVDYSKFLLHFFQRLAQAMPGLCKSGFSGQS